MNLRADTLFTYDARGRMLRSNEPLASARRPAPQIFLGYTVAGWVLRCAEKVPDALVEQVTEIVENQPPARELRVRPAMVEMVREALERHAPAAREESGPAFRFPDSATQAGDAVEIIEANVGLARDTYPWLLTELAAWWPCFAVVRDGAAVSVCYSARISEKMAEAGVDTLPGFRGQGFASAVTAAWGAAIRASGRVPSYSTSWENHASQAVARRLGLIMFGADVSWE